MNAANNGILKRLLGNQNLTVSFSEEETGDIKANVFSLLLSIYKSRVESEVRGSIPCFRRRCIAVYSRVTYYR